MEIQRDIPMPPRGRRFAALDELAVGESTTFPLQALSSLCACMQYRQRRYGKRFTRRSEGGVVRVWRTA